MMWERIVFLSFFAELCLAQQGALADIRARQMQAREAIANPIAAVMDLDKRQDATNAPGVLITVLFPEVPTGAPTGVAVPIEVTITGTALAATDIPSGFQTPTDVATLPAATETPAVASTPTDTTTQAPTTTNTPSTQPTTSDTTSISSTPTQSPNTASSTLSTTRSSSATSRSSTASRSSSASNSATAAASTNNHHDSLSPGAVAGIVIGVVAFVAALALMFLFLMRPSKRKSNRVSSPVYPEEAYLYDPPMTAAGGAGAPPMAMAAMGRGAEDSETRSLHAQSFGRPASRPPTPNHGETAGLLAGAAAGGAVAAGAAARSRRGTMSNQGSPMLRPQMGAGGYAQVRGQDDDVNDLGNMNPFRDGEYRDQDEVNTAYAGPSHAGPSGTTAWPMNPAAPSGLGTPPTSSAGPAPVNTQAAAVSRMDSVESRSQTPGSMYRQPDGSSDAMRNARRAWGMDDQ